jgi:hypothetical protein
VIEILFGNRFPEEAETIGMRVGRRPQQHAVNYAEYCGSDSDPEGQREDAGKGETGRFEQSARCVAKMIEGQEWTADGGGALHMFSSGAWWSRG